MKILVDADACPVKEEIYKVAYRREVPVTIVSNSPIRIPAHPLITREVVSASFDAADDWIAERADAKSVVVTADILLADRCLKAGATVIAPNGKPFTTSSIGGAIADRRATALRQDGSLPLPVGARRGAGAAGAVSGFSQPLSVLSSPRQNRFSYSPNFMPCSRPAL